MLIPGSTVPSLAQDDRIPILLTQLSLSPTTNSLESSTALTGWTLTIPSGWGMSFWSSLIFASPRPAGLLALSQAHFISSSSSSFPRDFPGTKSFEEFELRRADEERSYWERKPGKKRVNYEVLGTENPWGVAMEEVLRRVGGAEEGEKGWCVSRAGLEIVLGVLGGRKEGEKGGRERVVGIKNSRGREMISKLLDEIDHFLHPSPPSSKDHAQTTDNDKSVRRLLRTALVRIKLIPVERGVPEDLALIYALDDTLHRKVSSELRGKGKAKDESVRSSSFFPRSTSTDVRISRSTTIPSQQAR